MQIIYPPAVQELSKKLGVILPPNEEVQTVASVVSMGCDFGAEFGAPLKLKAFFQNTIHKAATTPVSTGTKPGIIKGQAVAFGIRSPNIKPAAAMAAADRLLGDPKIGNAQAVIRNTTALAALGDPSAKRGLTILQAVGTIRAKLQAKPGQKVIPAKATPARAVTIQRTSAQVKRLATKTAAKPVSKQNPGIIKKVLRWFGFGV